MFRWILIRISEMKQQGLNKHCLSSAHNMSAFKTNNWIFEIISSAGSADFRTTALYNFNRDSLPFKSFEY